MANTTISMWNVNNTEKRALFAGNEVGGSVRCITFSPDGNTLASIGNGLVITLWDVVKRKRRMCLKVNGDYGVSCLTFSVDGKRLITGGNTKLRIWDVADGRERGAIRAHSTTITSIACSKDGKTLVSGSLDKVVRVWDMDALIYDKK
jgi:WD40 repeat protein